MQKIIWVLIESTSNSAEDYSRQHPVDFSENKEELEKKRDLYNSRAREEDSHYENAWQFYLEHDNALEEPEIPEEFRSYFLEVDREEYLKEGVNPPALNWNYWRDTCHYYVEQMGRAQYADEEDEKLL